MTPGRWFPAYPKSTKAGAARFPGRTLPVYLPAPSSVAEQMRSEYNGYSMDKTIRRVTDLKEQQAETYRYWRSRPTAERFLAVWETTATAYAFTGVRYDPTRRSEATLTRVERTRS